MNPINQLIESLNQHDLWDKTIELKRNEYLTTKTSKLTELEINEIKSYSNQNFHRNIDVINIDKKYLYDLFIEKLNQKSHLINAVKKFNFIIKEDYSSNLEYEIEVDNLVSSFNIFLNNDLSIDDYNTVIEYNVNNLKEWEKFLKFLENETNQEIQKKISDLFIMYISNVEKVIRFQLEDVEEELSFAKLDEKKILLERKKKLLLDDKYVPRMKEVFSESLFSKKDQFYAARIVYNTTKYKESQKPKKANPILLSVLFSAIFGIFYVLIANKLQNRR